MKAFLLLCLLVIFQANYSMDPEPGVNDIIIELLGDPLEDAPDLSDKDWMKLIRESWLEEIQEESVSSEQTTEQFELKKTKILTDKKVNDIVLYFIRKGKNPNENNFVHRLVKRLDSTSEKQLKLFELLAIYGANLHQKNSEGETPYKIALKRKLDIRGDWISVSENPLWEKSYGYFPFFVTDCYRYASQYEKNGKTTLCVVQETGPFSNFENHYDFKNDKQNGFFQFAERYADQYNQNLEEHKKKAMHLLIFKLHKSSVKNLTAFLNSWQYRNDNYIFAALGDTCNRVNEALRILAILQKNKLIQKNHGKGPNEIYQGIADLLLYFYPPCQQKYAHNTNYNSWNPLNYNPLNPLFDHINNEFAPNEPSFYDKLIVFYSKDDPIAKGNVLDSYTIATSAITNLLAYTVSHYIKKKLVDKKVIEEFIGPLEENFSIKELKTLIKSLGKEKLLNFGLIFAGEGLKKLTFDASVRAFERKMLHAHTYFDIIPRNNAYENEYDICGPKAHVEIFEDGKATGNYNILLLKYFPLVWKILKNEYPGHFACSSNFIANINTEATNYDDLIQCFLEEYKSSDDNSGYVGCDPRNIELCGEENKYLIEALNNNPEARHELDLLRGESGGKNNNANSPHQSHKRIFYALYPPAKKWSPCDIL